MILISIVNNDDNDDGDDDVPGWVEVVNLVVDDDLWLEHNWRVGNFDPTSRPIINKYWDHQQKETNHPFTTTLFWNKNNTYLSDSKSLILSEACS